jgi:hypothetical protein
MTALAGLRTTVTAVNHAVPLASASATETTFHDHGTASTATALVSTQPNPSTQPDQPTQSAPAAAESTQPPPAVTIAVAPTNAPSFGELITGEVAFTNPVVAARQVLTFDPAAPTTLRVVGNLTVLGTLVMRPNPDVTHRIVFADRGELLVTGSGVLDIQGTPKVAWNRTGSDPSWLAPGDYQHDPFALGSAVPTYAGYKAEVANLTRNVIIDNPSRVMLHQLDGHAPQVIKYATISNAGVTGQAGFYALHFHLNGNATRGSIVEGVVIRDSKFRAFVPHGSHGITFRETLAVNVVANGYWWDPNRTSDPPDPIHESHDILYERAGVIGLSIFGDGREAGFTFGDGSGNVVRNSFASGVLGDQRHSGFFWPSSADSAWTVEGLVSHNNKGQGLFVWQNGHKRHPIANVDAYLNRLSGIEQGAYISGYQWTNVRLVGNGVGLGLRTFSRADPRQVFQCLSISNSPIGVLVSHAPIEGGSRTLISNLVLSDVGQEIVVSEDAIANGQTQDVRLELVGYQTPC